MGKGYMGRESNGKGRKWKRKTPSKQGCLLRSRDKDGGHTSRSATAIEENGKSHASRKLRGSMFYRTGVMGVRYLRECSCDLNLDPTSLIYEPDPYSLEIYWMCKYELSTSSLSKVIFWQTGRQTDRQRDKTEITYHAALRVVDKFLVTALEKCTDSHHRQTARRGI